MALGETRPAPTPQRTLARDRKRVLLAALDAGTSDKLGPAFARIDFDVSRAPTLRHAGRVAQFSRFDLILIDFIAEHPGLDTLLATLRHPGWANVRTRVALISAPEALATARYFGDQFGAKALDAGLGRLELQGAVLDLLRSRARLAPRIMARVTVRVDDVVTKQLHCQTYDLSKSGTFVITESRFPVGASVLFSLDLPGGDNAVQGEAEVVRHAAERRDRADGIGLRFVHFAADGDSRLSDFLARRLA